MSPKLLNCRDLELAVPGSYNPHQPIIRIKQVQSSLQVITSKQRPRKLCIKGDSSNYEVLTKNSLLEISFLCVITIQEAMAKILCSF